MVSGLRGLLLPIASFPIIDALRLQVIQPVAEMVNHTFQHSPLPPHVLGDRKQVILGDILKWPHLFATVFATQV